ncbi:MAG: polymer-forming cytoskeletal protein [Gemmatimonadota bacterium]|nr:polymer-forming cytoskeletal protein [Gemmatimonadota bacterium]
MRAGASVRAVPAIAFSMLLAFVATSGLRAQDHSDNTRAPSSSDAIGAALDSLHRDANGLSLSRSALSESAHVVEGDQHLTGDIASWHGPLEIRGIVDGNAVAIGSDVVLLPGGHVRGDALSVGGQVRMAGGTVDGETRTISAFSVGPIAGAQLTPAQATRRSLSLAASCYLILIAMALAVAIGARTHLETIASTIRTDFSRSFIFGLLGEIATVPLLVLSMVALAITLVGILLIPFAAVAYALATLGALALGFLAMSLLVGDAVMRGESYVRDPRPVISHLIAGLSIFLVLWLLAGGAAFMGLAGSVLRLLAFLSTWIAATVGLGATIITRGGTRAPVTMPNVPTPPAEEYAWQTPTPVSGVAAARRPTPAPRASEP